MKNNRSLFPPLFGEIPTGGGGGGSGNRIQLAELPEASLEYKDRIVQYIGATTGTLTNGYFYKCVEHTTTEGETITVTYSWDNVDVMKTGGYELVASVSSDGAKNYRTLFADLMANVTLNNKKIYLLKLGGFSQLYYETSRIYGTQLGFYQIYRNSSGVYTDDIILSSTLADNIYNQNGESVLEGIPSEGRIFKLFSISVDSTIL